MKDRRRRFRRALKPGTVTVSRRPSWGEAKFWLTPSVELANHTGLSPRQLREAQSAVERHIEEISHAWTRHFGG